MNAYLTLSIGSVFVSLLHLGFTADAKQPASAMEVELKSMLEVCLKQQAPDIDCNVIEKVLKKAGGM